jgi:hypothetical protein
MQSFSESTNLAGQHLLVSGTYFTTPAAVSHIAWRVGDGLHEKDIWSVIVKDRDVTIEKVEEYNEKDELQQIILAPDELIILTEKLADKLTEIEQDNYC